MRDDPMGMGSWTTDQIPDQAGRVAVVTGANSGLGLVTARELARAGARVVGTARDQRKTDSTRALIGAEVEGADLDLRLLDLASLDSVREFAAAVAADHGRVDVLVNNAGVMMPPRSETADGFELQFGTNHLGHFALTGLLLDALAAADSARVVTLSSLEHRPGRLDFDDLQSERDYSPRGAYQRSKFANAVFGLELDRRLRAAGLPVISLLAHPGYSATNLQSAGPTGPMKTLLSLGNKLIAQSAERGALPQIYAATTPGLEGGSFIGPDGFQELRGSPKLVEPVGRARDEETGRRLWQVSEQLTGVEYLSS
jgi:NAD(P)-dependent dehydrogenase (short-subunit alcohol dehydrogenase family)